MIGMNNTKNITSTYLEVERKFHDNFSLIYHKSFLFSRL